MNALLVSRSGRIKNCRCVQRRVIMYLRAGRTSRGTDTSAFRRSRSRGCVKSTSVMGANSFNGLTGDQKAELWTMLSARFADGASGNVSAFVSGADPKSIFMQVELRQLEKNLNVWSIAPR